MLLAIILLISTLSEIVSIGAVLPFLSVLVAPEKVFSMPLVDDVIGYLGITRNEQLIPLFTLVFISTAILAGIVRLLVTWVNTRLSYAAGHDISTQIYRTTLYQPYSVHIDSNSSDVISGINKVPYAISALSEVIGIINSVIVSLSIIVVLMFFSPLISSFTFLGFGFCYFLVVWFTRHRLSENSQRIALEATTRVKVMQEGLGSMREVLLSGNQPFFVDVYRRSDWAQRRAEGWNNFLSICPKYILEALGMVLIAVLAYGLSLQDGGLSDALPFLGALAVGAQRLLPALQQTYSAWIKLHGSLGSVNDVMDIAEQTLPEYALLAPPAALDFHEDIHFENVFFRYAQHDPWVLNDINLRIPRGAHVGFVGRTGSGKTTLLDLFMGLLLPTSGRIILDGVPLQGERLRAWQRLIAHVPQNIFLVDATLAENIAFGEHLGSIDMDLVEQATRQSYITDFIERSADGYNSMVGERGIRVSGGQRQRLVIARALYKQAKVLVFDEATSALDNTTEQSIMSTIKELGQDMTILVIAHRLTTLKYCDFIVELDQGRIVAKGTYDQIINRSIFREMNTKVI